MVIGAEQGDQGNHEAGMGLDLPPSLAQIRLVERPAPKPGAKQTLKIVQENYFGLRHETLERANASSVNPAAITRPQA